jgi:hypothetical protein
MAKYRDRQAATAFIRDQGIPMGDNRLADLAYEDRGPDFVLINGRACYTDQWLLEWIEAEAARSVKRRRLSAVNRPRSLHSVARPVKRRRSPQATTA